MKKFIIIISFLCLSFVMWDCAYYRLGWYIDLNPNEMVQTFVKTDETNIYLNQGNGYERFEIKGVNLGSSIPGEWSTDFSIDEDTYLRWFKYIQNMGANTIRVYTIQSDVFYNAFYKFNKDNSNPLYLLHGIAINDYSQNSHEDAYSNGFYENFLTNSKTMIDVIHGNKKISLGKMATAGHGTYKKDISPWVIGYILGGDWNDVTVAYTNNTNQENHVFNGKYMVTTQDASSFETLLAKVGNSVIEYESKRYKTQKLISFANWASTDPFVYPNSINELFMKCATIDVEHIKTTDQFISGQFASYSAHSYSYNFLKWMEDWSCVGLTDKNLFKDEKEQLNTYKAYLTALTNHHSIPVVISEFGVSTARGSASQQINIENESGSLSESQQGQALVQCYTDIISSGCAGSSLYLWQDEWFKKSWNTMYAVDLTRTPYWSDYQTGDQSFGLLAFDPGEEESICYVDGDISEWNDSDIISQNETMTLSAKYDEKYMYFLVKKTDLNLENDTLYLPIDTTPKTGTTYCENFDLKFDRGADFLIVLNGKDDSRIMVQTPYEALRSTYSQNILGFDTYIKENIPDSYDSLFTNIYMNLNTINPTDELKESLDLNFETNIVETGKLKYGNANPTSFDYDSLADFYSKGDFIEIKIPWQLMNFSDPSRMMIHDDYYSGNYGVEHIKIKEMYIGILSNEQSDRCTLSSLKLKGWENKVTYHERLKPAYYVIKELWKDND